MYRPTKCGSQSGEIHVLREDALEIKFRHLKRRSVPLRCSTDPPERGGTEASRADTRAATPIDHSAEGEIFRILVRIRFRLRSVELELGPNPVAGAAPASFFLEGGADTDADPDRGGCLCLPGCYQRGKDCASNTPSCHLMCTRPRKALVSVSPARQDLLELAPEPWHSNETRL